MKRNNIYSPGSIEAWSRFVIRTFGIAAVLLGLAAASATAQSMAGMLRDFKPLSAYVLAMGGAEIPGAEIYYSESAAAFLVIDGSFAAPVLIQPRKGAVETVQLLKVSKRDDGTIDLLPEPTLEPQGKFQIVEEKVVFSVDGVRAVLKMKPPLLGLQTATSLAAYDPEYGKRATAYTPSEATLKTLAAPQADVRVRVFFGTWCPHCQQAVPRVMKVDERLEGSSISFEYYGVPQGITQDPVAKRADIDGVPTAVVYRGDQEVGRLMGNDWKFPELALSAMLR